MADSVENSKTDRAFGEQVSVRSAAKEAISTVISARTGDREHL